jgi:hypothetical protein
LRAIAEGQDTIWRYVDVEILPSKLEFKGANLPLPGSFNQNQVQSFAWNPIPGADTYEFQLSSNPHFDNILKPIPDQNQHIILWRCFLPEQFSTGE